MFINRKHTISLHLLTSFSVKMYLSNNGKIYENNWNLSLKRWYKITSILNTVTCKKKSGDVLKMCGTANINFMEKRKHIITEKISLWKKNFQFYHAIILRNIGCLFINSFLYGIANCNIIYVSNMLIMFNFSWAVTSISIWKYVWSTNGGLLNFVIQKNTFWTQFF